jgi:hypothetical protein
LLPGCWILVRARHRLRAVHAARRVLLLRVSCIICICWRCCCCDGCGLIRRILRDVRAEG